MHLNDAARDCTDGECYCDDYAPTLHPPVLQVASYGARPIGPQTYRLPPEPWLIHDRDGTLRASPSFLDRQNRMKDRMAPPSSADLDFVDPERYKFVQKNPPGAGSFPWSTTPQRGNGAAFPSLDKFYDPNFGKYQNLDKQLETTSRKYAASFRSGDKRFKDAAAERPEVRRLYFTSMLLHYYTTVRFKESNEERS